MLAFYWLIFPELHTVIVHVSYWRLTPKHAGSYAGIYEYNMYRANTCIEYVYVTGIV